MANTKISELNAVTALAGTDVFPVVDVSASTTNKVSVEDLLRNAPDGTAGSPSIANAGDQDTGILFPADNSVGVSTGGTQRLVIDSSGNCGIATTSPSSRFHLTGTDNNFITLAHATRTGSWVIKHSGTNSENLEFQQNNGSTQVRSYLVGRDVHEFHTNGSEKVRIDSSGNVGIGASAPAAKLDVAGNQIFTAANPQIQFNAGGPIIRLPSANTLAFLSDSTTERLRLTSDGNFGIGTTAPNEKLVVSGNASVTGALQITSDTSAPSAGAFLFRPASNTLAFGSNSAERMRIDSSGRVGIGVASPGTDLDVNNGSANCTIRARTATGFSSFLSLLPNGSGTGVALAANADSSAQLFNQLNSHLAFGTNNIERMRITSDGLVYIGNSSPTIGGRLSLERSGFVQYNRCSGTGSGNIPLILERASDDGVEIEFKRANSVVGNINVTSTTTNYATSSDYRLKENVVDLDGAITRVKQLAPKRFNFIADADTTVDGFIAHEAQTVVPEAITGTHNEVDGDGNPVMQGIDQSKFVPLLTAALQEAITKIETLEAKVAALEAQ